MPKTISVVMLGASGAVGGEALQELLRMPQVGKISLLGRRKVDGIDSAKVAQHVVDIHAPASYASLLAGHGTAICTLGVGQPSKLSKEEFIRIDKDAPLGFAKQCAKAGVTHFALLSSVGANATSPSFYLRTKGELEDGLRALKFERLSLFHPSMILTPTNRYGVTQAITLAVWPGISKLLLGPLQKYRGIHVSVLGRAIASSVGADSKGEKVYEWGDLANKP
jgi:uncharacterized protein YbjT (DUF2867 family)